MVGTISWFSQFQRTKTNSDHLNHSRWIIQHKKSETLGILPFDTAKTISRLISLYKSLSNEQIFLLKDYIIRGKGVTYLTSKNERFLLTLACAEHLEDVDKAASTMGRLGLKCPNYSLVQFDQLYKDLKNGCTDMHKFIYGSKDMEKLINKMEKLTSLTTNLYDELESLSELEVSEQKLNEWRKSNHNSNTSYDLFDKKIATQRKLVHHLKDAAPPSTVGGAGLAPRYANVILLVERHLNSGSPICDQARRNLYNLLPARLKTYIRSKLRVPWREAEDGGDSGNALAEGWWEAVDGILKWLIPMAQDTLTWQAERSMENQRVDTKPMILLLQTLHYANLEKTEFAIAEERKRAHVQGKKRD
ncbi:hypothetical protein Cgig2_034050 [Carnegiea gigantea]|uniref:Uncharacterized protein n=1 Tax=Carnegiea gigantea TaxID=171969 RepID=A0A9Q1KJP5_9CARY|nr:hypothetical protein Cgig2_034050 [Carnegiea gigantea]